MFKMIMIILVAFLGCCNELAYEKCSQGCEADFKMGGNANFRNLRKCYKNCAKACDCKHSRYEEEE